MTAAPFNFSAVPPPGSKAEDYVSFLRRRFSSERRLPALLDVVRKHRLTQAPAIFWPVFQDVWPMCDDTWNHRHTLVAYLKAAGRCAAYILGDDKAAFDALPATITVFRGCSLSRSAGVAWTTDLKVAVGFATGHRNIQVHQPVVLKAQLDRRDVLTVFTERGEAEVLVDPGRLQGIETVRS